MRCELKDLSVYYDQLGEGRPIFMLHGWALNRHHLIGSIEPAFKGRTGWRRIYLDLPGHGKTATSEWIDSQDRVLEVVLDFIDAVAPGQRFVLAGTSLGAYLARGVALRRATLVDGLLMIVPLIVAADAQRIVPPHVTLVKDDALAAGLTPEQAEVFKGMVVVQDRRTFDDLTSPPPPADEAGDEVFQARIRNDPERYGFSFDFESGTAPLPAPTLIVAGRQDSVVGYRQAWDILEKYPRGTFAVLDRAGHFLEVEQQGLLGAMVAEWLDRVEEYARG